MICALGPRGQPLFRGVHRGRLWYPEDFQIHELGKDEVTAGDQHRLVDAWSVRWGPARMPHENPENNPAAEVVARIRRCSMRLSQAAPPCAGRGRCWLQREPSARCNA